MSNHASEIIMILAAWISVVLIRGIFFDSRRDFCPWWKRPVLLIANMTMTAILVAIEYACINGMEYADQMGQNFGSISLAGLCGGGIVLASMMLVGTIGCTLVLPFASDFDLWSW